MSSALVGGPVAAQEKADEMIPVIVELVDTDDMVGTDGMNTDAMNTDEIANTTVLESLGLIAADVTAAGLRTLEESPAVVSVRPARHDLRLHLDVSTATVGAGALHLDGYTGTGRTVAVIDSGVDADHPALAGSVLEQACYLEGVPTSGLTVVELCANGERLDEGSATSGEPCSVIPESCSHGTAVAGVISSDDDRLSGVAPDAGLLVFRVTAVVEGVADQDDPEYPYSAYIPEAGVLKALDRVYALRSTYDIAAVNLSLGGEPGICRDTVWEDVIDRLTDAGIAVVASSGNSGWVDAITFPACLPGVVSVGASTAAGTIAPFTNTGTALDLLAPASPVETTVLASYEPDGFAALSGTSFAAPHVSAGLALVDSALPNDWPVSRRRSLLRVSGEMITRITENPFDRDPRFPELRLESVVAFTPFSDATNGFWVAAADWAKATGVSTGIGNNVFGPALPLTRAQAVTFLWRFMGSPDHGTGSSFIDVDTTSWYGAAVAWAEAVGVTTGTTPTTFAPDDVVTRAQVAAFMWRTAGRPTVSTSAGFSDVGSGLYFTEAVDWMAANDITTGTSPSLYSPFDVVTRAQMVTFEHRLADADLAWTGSVAPPELALF